MEDNALKHRNIETAASLVDASHMYHGRLEPGDDTFWRNIDLHYLRKSTCSRARNHAAPDLRRRMDDVIVADN